MALARISILVFVHHSNGMDGILLCTRNLHGNYRLLRDTHTHTHTRTFKALQTIIAALAGQRATRPFRIQRVLDHVAYAHIAYIQCKYAPSCIVFPNRISSGSFESPHPCGLFALFGAAKIQKTTSSDADKQRQQVKIRVLFNTNTAQQQCANSHTSVHIKQGVNCV